MRTKIDGGDWHMKLADAVETAGPGDVIEVASWHAAQLGHTAAQRMRGEAHGITFEVDGKTVAYSDTDDPPEGA
jgi:hypothetical protein